MWREHLSNSPPLKCLYCKPQIFIVFILMFKYSWEIFSYSITVARPQHAERVLSPCCQDELTLCVCVRVCVFVSVRASECVCVFSLFPGAIKPLLYWNQAL